MTAQQYRPWPSEGLAINSMATLINTQAGELRAIQQQLDAIEQPVDADIVQLPNRP